MNHKNSHIQTGSGPGHRLFRARKRDHLSRASVSERDATIARGSTFVFYFMIAFCGRGCENATSPSGWVGVGRRIVESFLRRRRKKGEDEKVGMLSFSRQMNGA